MDYQSLMRVYESPSTDSNLQLSFNDYKATEAYLVIENNGGVPHIALTQEQMRDLGEQLIAMSKVGISKTSISGDDFLELKLSK